MFRWLRRASGTGAARPVRSRRARLMVQHLEGRVVPATVTNADDAGAGSLRQAILDANATPEADNIHFLSTFFNVPRTINLTSGELLVAGPVRIYGPGAERLTVQRDAAATNFRVFTVNVPAATATVEFSEMTIS